PFARPIVERLDELRLAVTEKCLEAELELGRGAELVPELEGLVAEHPLNDRLRGQLMVALYRAGRQAEALEVFRAGRAALVEAFGLEPTPALKELESRVLRHDPALDGGSRPQLAPARVRRSAGPRRPRVRRGRAPVRHLRAASRRLQPAVQRARAARRRAGAR